MTFDIKGKTPTEIDAEIKRRGREGLVSRECKHVTYVQDKTNWEDALIVKEWLTYEDGSRLPTLREQVGYQRPVWITKEPYRDHDEKIQFEKLNRLDKFNCRQIDMSRKIYERLRYGNPDWTVKKLARKPYIYGCDFGAEVYLKEQYRQMYPGVFEPNTVNVIDVETDVTKPGYDPILWSEVNDDEIVLYYSKEWTSEFGDYAGAVEEEYRKTLPAYLDQIRKKLETKGKYPEWIDDVERLPLRFVQADDGVGITTEMVSHLHLTQPDIVTGWNVFFDNEVMANTLAGAGLNPNDILSDPRVSPEFRMAYLKRGPSRRVTASGRDMPLSPHEQWHEMLHSASWRMNDAMQLYWQLRKAKGKESGGYGLDASLHRQLGVGKVKIAGDQIDVPGGSLIWHLEMQRRFKVYYGVYSIFDSVGLMCQERKNNDMSSQISSLAGSMDYSKFNSQPTVNAADMHFFALKETQEALCTTSDEMENETDETTLSRDNWIVTFPPHLVRPIGLKLFKDMPEVRSTFYMFGADADVETTYPTAEIIMNLGKEQTSAEPGRIPGITSEQQRRQFVNITAGEVNAVEIMQTVNGMASLDTWVDHIDNKYYADEIIEHA